MRRLLLSTALVFVLVGASADADCRRPQSWVAGTTTVCKGALVYGDYVGDDYGAAEPATTTNRIGNLSWGAGDQEYPEGQEATADLIRLTTKLKGRRLYVKALLNALYAPDQTIVAVAVDTDGDPATGGGQWGELGVSSGGWDKLATFARGNATTNTIKGSLRAPAAGRFRIQAVVANAETGEVMNVAFRPHDHPGASEDFANAANGTGGSFFEDDQAAALASGDISQFGYRVRLRALKRKRVRRPKVAPGLHERVYRSDYTVVPGEGMSYEGVPGRGGADNDPKLGFEQKFNFLGRYQPYGIYIPSAEGPHGLQFVYHGSGSNLSALIAQPGMQANVGEALNRIMVVPEARGTEGWNADISERDALDVLADVESHYDVDERRVFSGGYSQGGYVAYRMASLHPDVFAGLMDWVGFTGNGANGSPDPQSTSYTAGAVGNGIDFIKNLLNVPAVMLYAGEDELVHVWTANAMDEAFQATDNTYRFYLHPTAEHLTFAAADDWRKEAAYTKDLRLQRRPARVVFTTAPFLDSPQFGIRHDHAYWLSKIRTAGGAQDYGTVDLTNHGCGGKLARLERTSATGDDPVPWTLDEQRVASTQPLARRPRLDGTLTGIRSLKVDARAACLAGRRIGYSLTSDVPVTIRFSDGRTLRLPSGQSQATLGR